MLLILCFAKVMKVGMVITLLFNIFGMWFMILLMRKNKNYYYLLQVSSILIEYSVVKL